MPNPTTRVTDESATQPPVISVSFSREHMILTAIVVGQAVWLGFVMLRGWYSGADLPNLAYANGRSLGWDYLTDTLGGHFGLAQRLVYWLLNRAAPLEWWLTVVIRLVFQGITTVLLWRLFRTLVDMRPWVWLVLAGYAFSAYLVPGMAPLNSGLGLGIAQACLVAAMLLQVRYVRERRITDAALIAVLVLVMLAFAQQSAPLLAFLPLLSVVFLQEGSWRERLRGGLRLWPGWLLVGVGVAVFAGLYLSGNYNSPSSDFTFSDGLWVVGQAWLNVLGPALLGGPWQFYSFPNQWSDYADPPVVLVVLGQLALVVLVLASVRRNGWIALFAWLIPVWTVTTSLVLVGTGRSWLEQVLPTILRYSYFVPVALALGIVLAFGSTRTRERARTRAALARRDFRGRRALLGGAVLVLLVANAVSTLRFADRFWENPAEDYAATLLQSVKEQGPGVQLYDTLLPESVVPYISEMFVSDLLALGAVSAEFEGQSANRLVVDSQGRLVPARFIKVADLMGPRVKGCGIFVRGEGTTRVRLTRVSRSQEWFLQLELYQPRDNRVALKVLDGDGEEISITSGSSMLDVQGSLAVAHRRLDTGQPDVLEIHSDDPETNFCLVHAYVGVPLP